MITFWASNKCICLFVEGYSFFIFLLNYNNLHISNMLNIIFPVSKCCLGRTVWKARGVFPPLSNCTNSPPRLGSASGSWVRPLTTDTLQTGRGKTIISPSRTRCSSCVHYKWSVGTGERLREVVYVCPNQLLRNGLFLFEFRTGTLYCYTNVWNIFFKRN